VPLAAVSRPTSSTFDTKIVSQRQSTAANGGQRRLKKMVAHQSLELRIVLWTSQNFHSYPKSTDAI